jgi:general secretion pathway protein M
MPLILSRLTDRYSQLDKRERSALVLLACFFACLFFYFAIWSPADQFLRASEAELERQLSLVQYMRASEKEARASSKGAKQAPTGQSLLTVVSRAAQQAGIKPNRLQPEGSGAVSIWFDTVAFDALMRMLNKLQANRSIVVQQISLDREEQPGMVRARIVLRS